jgi:uracil-DNA glycosylase
LNRLTAPLASLLDADFGDWQPLLEAWRRSDAGQALIGAVDRRVHEGAVVYPAQVFRAFALTPLARTRVLILGQDPYHGPGQAEGLAFSVPAGQRIPPSLRNIFKELQRDLDQVAPASGSLAAWAGRGVLLLNTTLTVEAGQAASHAQRGWQALTDAVCQALWADVAPKVFMLWGAHAQARLTGLAGLPAGGGRHLVLQANHPSPLSALRPPVPFIGCGHFRRASAFLAAAGRGAVDWHLSDSRPVV